MHIWSDQIIKEINNWFYEIKNYDYIDMYLWQWFFGTKYLIINSNLPWAHDPELRNHKYVPISKKILQSHILERIEEFLILIFGESE